VKGREFRKARLDLNLTPLDGNIPRAIGIRGRGKLIMVGVERRYQLKEEVSWTRITAIKYSTPSHYVPHKYR